MFSATTPPGWQAFARLQHSIDNRIITPIALGDEEALFDLLDVFAKDPVPTAEHIERRFRSIRRNRVRKQLRRVGLLLDSASRKQAVSPSKCIDDADELRFARCQTTTAEWALFLRVAAGDSRAEIAHDIGLSLVQLRTRLCRLRSRLQTAARRLSHKRPLV